jgi:diguanylate cyclase (GGDEF)-like protein
VQQVVAVLLTLILILVSCIKSGQSDIWKTYIGLIISLLILDVISLLLSKQNRYTFAAVLVVIITIAGPWGSYLLDPSIRANDLFPLIYGTISVIISGLFLTISITFTIALVQFILLNVAVFTSPVYQQMNWASFLVYFGIICVLSIVANIFIHKQMESLRSSNETDHLTGLYNRLHFDSILGQAVNDHGLKYDRIGLIMLDVDNFKKYNDTYGHTTGDAILQEVAAVLRQQSSENHMVFRFGGDEFSIIAFDTDTIELNNLSLSLVESIRGLSVSSGGHLVEQISISLGAVLLTDENMDSQRLISYADSALLKAKAEGKNCVRIYNPNFST